MGDDPESAKYYNLLFFIGTEVYLRTQSTPYGKSISMLSDKCLQFVSLLLACPNKNTISRNWGYAYKKQILNSF